MIIKCSPDTDDHCDLQHALQVFRIAQPQDLRQHCLCGLRTKRIPKVQRFRSSNNIMDRVQSVVCDPSDSRLTSLHSDQSGSKLDVPIGLHRFELMIASALLNDQSTHRDPGA